MFFFFFVDETMYVKVLEGHGAKEIVIIYYTLYLM